MLNVLTDNLWKGIKNAYIPAGKQEKRIPILTHILIFSAPDGLYVGMTNLSESTLEFVPVKWTGPRFAACAPARTLKDWLGVTRRFTDLIELQFNDNMLIIKADNTKASFNCIGVEEFPFGALREGLLA